MKNRVLRPQALVFGILAIFVGLFILASGTWEWGALVTGCGVLLLLLSGYIIRMPW